MAKQEFRLALAISSCFDYLQRYSSFSADAFATQMGHHCLHLQLSKATHSSFKLRQVIDSDLMVQDLIQQHLMNLVSFFEVVLFEDSFCFQHPFKDSSNAKSHYALAITHIQAIIRSDQIRRPLGF